jgi:hypothetical protein
MQKLLNQLTKTIIKKYKLFFMLIALGIIIPFSIIYYQYGYKIYFNQIVIDNSHVKNYTSQLNNIMDTRHQLNVVDNMYQSIDKLDMQFFLRTRNNSFYYNKFANLGQVIATFFSAKIKNKTVDKIIINYPSIKNIEVPDLNIYKIYLDKPILKVNVLGNLNKATNTKFMNEYINYMNSLFKVPQKEFEELIIELKKSNSEIKKVLNEDLTQISDDKKLFDSILKKESKIVFQKNNIALIKLIRTFKKYEVLYSDELILFNNTNSNFDNGYYLSERDSINKEYINILSDDNSHPFLNKKPIFIQNFFYTVQNYKNLTNFAFNKIKEELATIEILDEFISSEEFSKQHDFFIFNSTQDKFFFDDSANSLFFIILVLYSIFGIFILFLILSIRKP